MESSVGARKPQGMGASEEPAPGRFAQGRSMIRLHFRRANLAMALGRPGRKWKWGQLLGAYGGNPSKETLRA